MGKAFRLKHNLLSLPTNVQIGHKNMTYCTEEEALKNIEYSIKDLKGDELKILNGKYERKHN